MDSSKQFFLACRNSFKNRNYASESNGTKNHLYTDQNHKLEAFEIFNAMRRENVFCDVVLVADGIEIRAHRMLLAGCSPYFHAMFTKFDEMNENRIEIKEVDPLALQTLIEYVYTAEILVTEETVQILLPAANLLRFPRVVNACCNFLASQLHSSNCLGIRAFADLHGCPSLLEKADHFISQNFSEVVAGEEFFSLPSSRIIEIIKVDELNVYTEEELFECVMRWVNREPGFRSQHLPSLMEHVRLPLIRDEYLSKTPRTKPRYLRNTVGGFDNQFSAALNTTEVYDIKTQQWEVIASKFCHRHSFGIGVLNNQLYAVGGVSDNGETLGVAEVFDPRTQNWKLIAPMLTSRSCVGVGVLNNLLYVVGGESQTDTNNCLNTVECYNPETDTWRRVCGMLCKRTGPGVGVMNGKLYAIGGVNENQYLETVEMYNPRTDVWEWVSVET